MNSRTHQPDGTRQTPQDGHYVPPNTLSTATVTRLHIIGLLVNRPVPDSRLLLALFDGSQGNERGGCRLRICRIDESVNQLAIRAVPPVGHVPPNNSCAQEIALEVGVVVPADVRFLNSAESLSRLVSHQKECVY